MPLEHAELFNGGCAFGVQPNEGTADAFNVFLYLFKFLL